MLAVGQEAIFFSYVQCNFDAYEPSAASNIYCLLASSKFDSTWFLKGNLAFLSGQNCNLKNQEDILWDSTHL